MLCCRYIEHGGGGVLEVMGSWRGRPGLLRLDGAAVELIGEGDDRLTIQLTEFGPRAVATGSLLRVGDSEIDVEGADAAERASELAAEVNEVVRLSGAVPMAVRGPTIGLGRVLAIIGAVLVVVGTWAGWATVDDFGSDGFGGNGFGSVDTDLAQQLSLFSSGAFLWWLTGVMLVIGGFVVDRLDGLRRD